MYGWPGRNKYSLLRPETTLLVTCRKMKRRRISSKKELNLANHTVSVQCYSSWTSVFATVYKLIKNLHKVALKVIHPFKATQKQVAKMAVCFWLKPSWQQVEMESLSFSWKATNFRCKGLMATKLRLVRERGFILMQHPFLCVAWQ